MMVKTRTLPENNYRAIYFNGKTIRVALDKSKPITELSYPEFYDVKLTGKCRGGCEFCYMDSKEQDSHYNISGIDKFFGNMTDNQKPFQIAIGGGNPNSHPKFIELLKKTFELGITPNYTTNGMDITDEIIQATKKYCGGVAISCHSHLAQYWRNATERLLGNGVIVNFHLIISDKDSVNNFITIYKEYKNKIDYFVLLPYITQGRAKQIDTVGSKNYLFEKLKKINLNKIAFGANFYKDIKQRPWIKASLYAPEGFSKYLDLKDMKVYKSSFNLTEVKE
jgi:organic radical activating enzyme